MLATETEIALFEFAAKPGRTNTKPFRRALASTRRLISAFHVTCGRDIAHSSFGYRSSAIGSIASTINRWSSDEKWLACRLRNASPS